MPPAGEALHPGVIGTDLRRESIDTDGGNGALLYPPPFWSRASDNVFSDIVVKHVADSFDRLESSANEWTNRRPKCDG